VHAVLDVMVCGRGSPVPVFGVGEATELTHSRVKGRMRGVFSNQLLTVECFISFVRGDQCFGFRIGLLMRSNVFRH